MKGHIDYPTTELPNHQTAKLAWMAGGRREKAIFRAGGFALEGREGSG